MKTKDRMKLDHLISVVISVVLNGVLIGLMLHFITTGTEQDREMNTTMVIEPADDQVIEEIEEEIIEEPVVTEEMKDVEFTTDFEMEVEVEFEVEQEVVDAPQENTDMNQLSELLSDIASPVVMSGLMQGRGKLARSAMVKRYGGSRGGEGQVSVDKALQWLKRHQLPDGGWSQTGTGGRACPGHTGLALLAFLSHGETPSSAEYGETVARAIRWIVENQNANGIISQSSHTAYGHAMSTYALAESYSVTQNILIREPLIKAVDAIVAGMQANGGFDYDYKKGERNDCSVGGWQVQALKAATLALPEEPRYKEALSLAMDGMLANSRTSQDGVMTIGYTSPGANINVTAAGTLGMIFSGRGRSKEVKQMVAALEPIVPKWGEANKAAIYLWYYTAQALFQHNPDGSLFRRFNEAMVKELIANQNADGSWDDPGGGGVRGLTGYTAMGALNMMVYYRHLPTGMVVDTPAQTPASATPGVEDDDIITITL